MPVMQNLGRHSLSPLSSTCRLGPESERKVKMFVAQSCLTLCDSMDCSLPGSSVHGILQARILEWVAISVSKLKCYLPLNERCLSPLPYIIAKSKISDGSLSNLLKNQIFLFLILES